MFSGGEGGAESAASVKRSRTDRGGDDADDSSDDDDDVEKQYEQEPRAFPVVRDLLPIKTKTGVVKRKMLVKTRECMFNCLLSLYVQ